MEISNKGIQLLKNHEKLRLRAYDDKQPNVTITSQSQIIGVLTIGYGHTGNDVFVGQTINEAKAEQLLKSDLKIFVSNINKVKVPLTQNMFDALVSLAFNIGNGNFNSSTLLSLLNTANYLASAEEFPKWRKSGGVVMQGLVVRRAEERELFLTGLGSNTYYNTGASNNDGIAILSIATILSMV